MTHDNQNTEHDTEIARLRREHAAMKAFIKRCKSIPRRSNEGLDELYQQACTLLYEIENAAPAIAATPDTPPAGVTGSGGRYVPIACPTCRGAGIRLVFGNEHADCVDCNGSGECGEIQIFDTPAGKAYMEHLDTVEKRALEAATNRTLNAALPASGGLVDNHLIELAMLLQPSFEKGMFVQLVKNGAYGYIFNIDKHGIHLDLGDMGSTTNGYETVEPEQIKRVSGAFVRYCPKCTRVAANQDEGFCECGRALEWWKSTKQANAAPPASGTDTVAGSGNGGE